MTRGAAIAWLRPNAWVLLAAMTCVANVSAQGGDARGPAAEHEYEMALGRSVRVPPGTIAKEGLVAVGGSVEVDGEAVGDAVAVGGDVVVRGRLEGDALALAGRVRVVGPDAVVTGNAFSLFGGVTAEGGGRVEGRVRALSAVDEGRPPGYFDVAFSRPVLLARLLCLLFWVMAAIGAAFLAPRTVAAATAELRRHAVRLTGIGALLHLSLLLSGIIAVALIQVFIGIPLLALLLIGWSLLAAASLAASFHALGERVAERLREGATSGYVELLAGALVVGVLHFVPLLGELITLGVLLAGSGAVLATRTSAARRAAAKA